MLNIAENKVKKSYKVVEFCDFKVGVLNERCNFASKIRNKKFTYDYK